MVFYKPRIVIGALRGGSGKTTLAIGLLAAWQASALPAAPFKKGPDFIDSGWLAFAAGRNCYNLDPFLMDESQILASLSRHSQGAELALIEGNRGLFDGLDLEGRYSTAQLARTLQSPLLLLLDVTMVTRTAAALVRGCQVFDPDLRLAAVVLNRVAGQRQESLVRRAIESYCGIPVVGSIRRLKQDIFPERHMGLIPHQERAHAFKAVDRARRLILDSLQLEDIRRIAESAPGIPQAGALQAALPTDVRPEAPPAPRIGFIRDRAFWFYYPENLELLQNLGAELVEVNALADRHLPPLDALYIGGGFPETQARPLADNALFRGSLRSAIEDGLPVYAECGGLMYLGKHLVIGAETFPMLGVFPVDFVLQQRPQGHGYTILEVQGSNPFFPVGETIKGHEFHYSKAVFRGADQPAFAFRVRRGSGIDGRRDGLCYKNVLATYSHLHAAGYPLWARGLYRQALARRPARDFFQKND